MPHCMPCRQRNYLQRKCESGRSMTASLEEGELAATNGGKE